MSEAEIIARTGRPHTAESMARDLRMAGLGAGDHVMVHVSMSRIGWIVGGAEGLIKALQDVVTDTGTILMPAHTTYNSDPALWEHPPVPMDWVPTIREHAPPFDPARSPCRALGAVPDLFRTLPGVFRSSHPLVSCAAWGKFARFLTEDHRLGETEGPNSPVGRLYELNGKVLLVGVDHWSNTSLHLAEHKAEYPGKRYITEGSSVIVGGARRWLEYEILLSYGKDFQDIGLAFERSVKLPVAKLGNAEVRLMRQRDLVDFAVTWMEANRKGGS